MTFREEAWGAAAFLAALLVAKNDIADHISKSMRPIGFKKWMVKKIGDGKKNWGVKKIRV